MVHQIGADGVVDFHLESEFELCADSVHARNQHGIEILSFIDREKRAKSANFAENAPGKGLVGEILDALLGTIGLINVDARVCVSNGFGILGHGASVNDVREPDSQGKNLEIVARWRRRKGAFTAEYAESAEKFSPLFLLVWFFSAISTYSAVKAFAVRFWEHF
jgi:hypothetical protein